MKTNKAGRKALEKKNREKRRSLSERRARGINEKIDAIEEPIQRKKRQPNIGKRRTNDKRRDGKKES